MKVKTTTLIGPALEWVVATCEGLRVEIHSAAMIQEGRLRCLSAEEAATLPPPTPYVVVPGKGNTEFSTSWAQGGPVIERENITLIRANDEYIDGKNIPSWFAETSKWVGHNISTSYEGEQFDPCFMVDEGCGYYGPTPLIAGMRCYVASKLGDEVNVPDELVI